MDSCVVRCFGLCATERSFELTKNGGVDKKGGIYMKHQQWW